MRNKAHPKGSIAKSYLAQECLNFCSRYLVRIGTKLNQPPWNDDEHDDCSLNGGLEIFALVDRPLGSPEQHYLNSKGKRHAHLYMLNNYEEVWLFIE